MVKKPNDFSDFLPLSAVAFHILLTLVEEEKHGYAIRKDVEAETDGSVVIHIGSLYNQINRLLKQDLIQESDNRPPSDDDDPRRRYYELTQKGRKVLAAELDRVQSVMKMVEKKNIYKKI